MPLLMVDFYKTCHAEQYPMGLTKIMSYFTPRSSRLTLTDHVVNFGLQGFIKEYLCDMFEENFFSRTEEEVMREYERVLDATLGHGLYGPEKVRSLHRLGYLPLEIGEVPEGTRVPMKVPMMYVTNTHPDFAWLVGTIESVMSAYLWHPMVCAEVGYQYRQIAKKWYEKTVDEGAADIRRAIGDFSFRGQESPEAATTSSAGWLLSNVNTATVPAILYMEDFYNVDCEQEEVGFGAVSTEHSVMCSSYAVDGNEKTMLVRLLTETYKDAKYFTCVCDSYDYFNVLQNILPEIKDIIIERDGVFAIRGDSGDPVETICKTVQILWDIFGGHVNEKGYKVLEHTKAVWGDAVTLQRAEAIYKKLADEMKFSAQNVSLGAGSFSLQSIQEDEQLKPFTRDTFSFAFKATHGWLSRDAVEGAVICGNDGIEGFGCPPWEIDIFKDPKTDSGIKRSQKGLIRVYHTEDGELAYQDGYYEGSLVKATTNGEEQVLEPIFMDGKFVKEQSLEEVRQVLWDGKFYE